MAMLPSDLAGASVLAEEENDGQESAPEVACLPSDHIRGRHRVVLTSVLMHITATPARERGGLHGCRQGRIDV